MRSGRIASRKVAPETRRCAIYTRKSTSVGLEQDFNSLDAQREACAAYIQRQPGWTVVGERYDDGGFTGANIERPAFQRLLADIEAGKIDVVVVYKVDCRGAMGIAMLFGAHRPAVSSSFAGSEYTPRPTPDPLVNLRDRPSGYFSNQHRQQPLRIEILDTKP